MAGTLAAGCGGGGYVEIPIQTPIAPKLDISPFQRVYVAGFLAGANDDVDANMETVRLLRSQLRNKNVLRVVDADTRAARRARARGSRRTGSRPPAPATPAENAPVTEPADGQLPAVQQESDLDRYAKVFDDKEYWKQIGDEHEQALIVTGSVLFVPHARFGFVQREQETYDSFGRRVVVPTRSLHGAQGLHPAPDLRVHRRAHRRAAATASRSGRRSSTTPTSRPRPCRPTSSSWTGCCRRSSTRLSAQKIRGNRVLLK